MGLYFLGLGRNSAEPAYAYGHQGVPPTFSTFEQLKAHPGQTLVQMGLFIVGMFGNAVGRGFPVLDNLMLVRRAGAVVLLLALVGLYARVEEGSAKGTGAALGVSLALLLPDGGLRMHRACLAWRIPTAHDSIHDVWHILRRGCGAPWAPFS